MPRAEEPKEQEPEEQVLKIPHNLNELEQTARAVAARHGIAGRITDVIYHLVAAGQPISDSHQLADPSGTYYPVTSQVPARRGSNNDEAD